MTRCYIVLPRSRRSPFPPHEGPEEVRRLSPAKVRRSWASLTDWQAQVSKRRGDNEREGEREREREIEGERERERERPQKAWTPSSAPPLSTAPTASLPRPRSSAPASPVLHVVCGTPSFHNTLRILMQTLKSQMTLMLPAWSTSSEIWRLGPCGFSCDLSYRHPTTGRGLQGAVRRPRLDQQVHGQRPGLSGAKSAGRGRRWSRAVVIIIMIFIILNIFIIINVTGD